jgi:hypothetical protein
MIHEDDEIGGKACAADGCNHVAAKRGLCLKCHKEVETYLGLVRAVRRTARLLKRIPNKELAGFIMAMGHDSDSDIASDVCLVGTSLDEVWDTIRKEKPGTGPICRMCGRECWQDRKSRYCSSKCRQKAYRRRVTEKALAQPGKRNDVTDSTSVSADTT